jgi:hypothetical protein
MTGSQPCQLLLLLSAGFCMLLLLSQLLPLLTAGFSTLLLLCQLLLLTAGFCMLLPLCQLLLLTAGFSTLLLLRPAAVSCPRLPNSCTEAIEHNYFKMMAPLI